MSSKILAILKLAPGGSIGYTSRLEITLEDILPLVSKRNLSLESFAETSLGIKVRDFVVCFLEENNFKEITPERLTHHVDVSWVTYPRNKENRGFCSSLEFIQLQAIMDNWPYKVSPGEERKALVDAIAALYFPVVSFLVTATALYK